MMCIDKLFNEDFTFDDEIDLETYLFLEKLTEFKNRRKNADDWEDYYDGMCGEIWN